MASDLLPVKATANLDATELMKFIYQDAAQPACKVIGQALGTVLGLANTILLPLKLLNDRSRLFMQRNLDDYAKRLESIPRDKIEPVPPELGLPILDKFTYLDEGEIRDMYMRLLVSASNKDTMSKVHPSALNIIEMLSPDEALILRHIGKKRDIPFSELRLQYNNDEGYRVIIKYLTGFEIQLSLMYPGNMILYFDNLIATGVLQNMVGIHVMEQNVYTELESLYKPHIAYLKTLENDSEDLSKLEVEKGVFAVSEIGRRFIDICCLEHVNNG